MNATQAVEAPHFLIEPLENGAIFRLNRPHKLNAITKQIKQGLRECLDGLEQRKARVLLIVGEGERAFCAGTDLAEWPTLSIDERAATSALAREFLYRLSRSSVLSIAAMNGLAFGGGLELAMACTFRVAAPHVEVSLPEIKLGLIPAYAGTQFLPALIGQSRALEMMLTGRRVPTQEAHAMGLLNRIAQPGVSALDAARTLAAEVCGYGAVAISAVRQSVDAAGPAVTVQGLAVEDAQVRRVAHSEDAREGVRAFLEKRAPKFTGR